MPDPAPARKTGPWPLVAISVLVALLVAFLVLTYRRQDRERALVHKTPPTAAPEETKVEPPVAVPPTPPDPPPAPGDALRAEIKKAVDARRWDEAEKLLAGAKDVAALDDLRRDVAAGRAAEEKARAEARALEEAKRKRDQAWLVAREKHEKAKDVNRWDEAVAILEDLLKEHPDLARVEEVAKALKDIRDLRSDSDEKVFVPGMREAEKHFKAGRYAQADAAAELLIRHYPERTDRVRAFQQKVRAAKLEAEMIRIPDALCWVGSDASPDEKPMRQVKLAPFFIDRYEVSNEDYMAFVLATGHPAPPHWNGKAAPKGRERHPVLFVSYDDATSYAKWAGKRLPTAEEWEVAARGPDKREFPWGNAFSEKENTFPCNSIEYWQVQKAIPTTLAVDAPSLANGESAFRVWGMGGNAWEWTSSAVPGKSGEQLLEFRILKGGSFLTPSKALRCANVLAEDPRLGHPDVGFRCARDAR